MPYSLIIEREPISVNNNNGHDDYEKELLALLKDKYPLKDGKKTHYNSQDKIYVQIFYIYKGRIKRDIDNIIKYIVDSFRKYLYKDDKQITYVLSQSIACKEGEITEIDITQMDDDCADKLTEFLLAEYDKEDVSRTYFECGVMNSKFYHLNLENLWK